MIIKKIGHTQIGFRDDEVNVYDETRERSMTLQRPYVKNAQKIVDEFLYHENTLNENE